MAAFLPTFLFLSDDFLWSVRCQVSLLPPPLPSLGRGEMIFDDLRGGGNDKSKFFHYF